MVADRAHEVVAAHLEESTFDFRELAFRLPLLVISDLLGVPADDITAFDDWSATLLALGDQKATHSAAAEEAQTIALEARNYFDDVITSRRSCPGDDLISRLVEQEGGAGLSTEEIAAMCIILHIGGHATTTDALTNGMFRLLSEPSAYTALRENPTLVPTAIEEFLRFDPPIFVTLERIAAKPQLLGGHSVPEGDLVYAVIGAANRDPNVFDAPDRFDIHRRDNRHMSFAGGAHFCLGAHLARLEARALLTELLTGAPALELGVAPEDVIWMDSFLHRGTTGLPVRWCR